MSLDKDTHTKVKSLAKRGHHIKKNYASRHISIGSLYVIWKIMCYYIFVIHEIIRKK